MNILFLTQIVPYPPDAGPRVKTWHALRFLVQRGHHVTLATFYREEEAQHLEILNKLCQRVVAIPMKRSRIADMGYFLRSTITGRPFLIERDDLPPFRRAVEQIVAQEHIDVIHADQLGMAQFAQRPKDYAGQWPATVFDAHNAVWAIVERMEDTAHPLLKPVLRLETGRVRRYEGRIVRSFDHILSVSELDAAALRAASRADGEEPVETSRMTVIPIAVDTEVLRPVQQKPGSKNILTLGTLHYPPNADGIRWFANEVFPLVLKKEPDATLTIVGKNPPPDFVQMAAKFPGVINVTGYVSDLTPYMEAAALVAVPVRAGGGIRVRILESFARAMPVVTTTVGLEGIQARQGLDVLVADTAASQADAVLRVLEDQDLRKQLANNGRELAVSRYDWHIALEALDRIYANIQ